MAAGQYSAGQQLRDAIGAVAAGIADPQDGIHRAVLLQFFDLHGGAGVQQHHDPAETLAFDPVDQVTFIVRKGQDVAGGRVGKFIRIFKPVQPRIEAAGFAGIPAQHDNGGVLVAADQGGVILRYRHFMDLGALILIVVDDIAARSADRPIIRDPVLIELDHVRVDREALFGERVRQGDGLGNLDQLAHGTAELHFFTAAHAEQGHVPAFDRRQPLEGDAAFGGGAGTKGDLRSHKVRCPGIIGLVTVITRVRTALDTGRRSSQQLVHLAGPGIGHREHHVEDDGAGKEDARQAAEQAFLFHTDLPLFGSCDLG